MKKIKRNFMVDYYLSWTYGVSISQIREDLDALEKLGVTSIDIEAYSDYGSPCVSIEAIANRLETDDEYLERLIKEEKIADEIKQRELKQLELLSAKYKINQK